jgi:hypothetical protein
MLGFVGSPRASTRPTKTFFANPPALNGKPTMPLVRITQVKPLTDYRLQLSLTDGREIEKDVRPLFIGPVFDQLRNDPSLFAQARVVRGTVVWPGDVDLDPDVLIWGGPPPNQWANGEHEPVGESPLPSAPIVHVLQGDCLCRPVA